MTAFSAGPADGVTLFAGNLEGHRAVGVRGVSTFDSLDIASTRPTELNLRGSALPSESVGLERN